MFFSCFQLLNDWLDSAVPGYTPGMQVCREYFCIFRVTCLRSKLMPTSLLRVWILFLSQIHSTSFVRLFRIWRQ